MMAAPRRPVVVLPRRRVMPVGAMVAGAAFTTAAIASANSGYYYDPYEPVSNTTLVVQVGRCYCPLTSIGRDHLPTRQSMIRNMY